MFDLPQALLLARLQFAFTVSFHFLFPAVTIGLASYLAPRVTILVAPIGPELLRFGFH